MKTKVKIDNVKWDFDEEDSDIDLPTSITKTFEYEEDDELEDIISDWLSDEYGYCHNGFDYKIEI